MSKHERAPKPIESFGPELFQALLEGSKKKLVLKMPYTKAVRFRLRINQLRETMRRLQHEKYTAVSQARITVKWPEGTPVRKYPGGNLWPVDKNVECEVIIQPNDNEFRDVLAAAGVTVPILSETTMQTPQGSSGEPDILEEFLKRES